MNRADLLYSVLQDGRTHSRQDIFDQVGFQLTNNAASELRARGVGVEHRVKDGLHTYRLLGEAAGGERTVPSPAAASPSCPPNPLRDDGNREAPGRDEGQLALSIPRTGYEREAA